MNNTSAVRRKRKKRKNCCCLDRKSGWKKITKNQCFHIVQEKNDDLSWPYVLCVCKPLVITIPIQTKSRETRVEKLPPDLFIFKPCTHKHTFTRTLPCVVVVAFLANDDGYSVCVRTKTATGNRGGRAVAIKNCLTL